MIPLGDDNSHRKHLPIVTYALIAINIFFFFLESVFGEPFIIKWSFVPSRFLQNPGADISTVFTAMFMHGSMSHIAGNMMFLWIYGDNVEDHLGRMKYLMFYLFCGVAATLAQLGFDPASSVPNLGASGAIAGVLGAYLRLFPNQKVTVLLGKNITQVPSIVVIGLWFAFQFVSGVGSWYSTQSGEGGVAYMAHIGGFVAGFLISLILPKATDPIDLNPMK